MNDKTDNAADALAYYSNKFKTLENILIDDIHKLYNIKCGVDYGDGKDYNIEVVEAVKDYAYKIYEFLRSSK